MAGRFMIVKKVVLPIMSVIILCSQLAGCASLNSQEFLETVNNVDEVIIETNELDPSSSSASSSDSVKIGDKAYAYDFDNQSTDEEDPEVGVISTEQAEPEELSGDALIDFFKLAYDISKPYTDTLSTKEAIAFELYALDVKAEVDNKGLPVDYADQYRAWRPVEEAPAQQAQQVSEATQNQDQGSNQQQNQSQSQQNQSATQQTKPSTQTQPTTPQPSGGKAMYDGFNTYDEYIQDLHRQFPEYSIEQIKEAFPDQATGEVGEAAEWDAQAGLLNGG